MKKYFFDLHIHSALSPCSDNDMTPNNIVNMALLKGLDFISVTDHNTVQNIEAVVECAKNTSLVVIPGMEVETSEEIHLLTLFRDINDLKILAQKVQNSLPNIKNREDIFGQQLIVDSKDNIIGKEEKLLLIGCKLSIDEVVKITRENNGVAIPSHIDRQGYSIINTFGYIPQELGFTSVEISSKVHKQEMIKKYNFLVNYNVITSSDAHKLGDILEPSEWIELEKKSIDEFLDTL